MSSGRRWSLGRSLGWGGASLQMLWEEGAESIVQLWDFSAQTWSFRETHEGLSRRLHDGLIGRGSRSPPVYSSRIPLSSLFHYRSCCEAQPAALFAESWAPLRSKVEALLGRANLFQGLLAQVDLRVACQLISCPVFPQALSEASGPGAAEETGSTGPGRVGKLVPEQEASAEGVWKGPACRSRSPQRCGMQRPFFAGHKPWWLLVAL